MTDDSQPTLNGTAEPGSKVTVYDNGQPLGTTTADPSGNWSFTPSKPISEGPHSFTADATDAAGNTGPTSDPYGITTDYTAPDYSKLAITGVLDNVGNVTGNIASGGETDDKRPVISGTGTAGDTVIVYTKDANGNHEIGRTTVDADSRYACPLITVVSRFSGSAPVLPELGNRPGEIPTRHALFCRHWSGCLEKVAAREAAFY